MTFVPLDTISDNTTVMNKTITETILRGIGSNAYPEGLRKQYEVQLKWLQDKIPSLEIVFAPAPIAAPGKPVDID